MRRQLISVCAALALGAAALGAQDALPPAIAADVARLYNAPAALRATGALSVPADQLVTGDVAVLSGPVTIAGRVTGRVLVVNGDVTLERGARIDGDLIVIGGSVRGQDGATIGGQVQRYEQPLRYHIDADRIVADLESDTTAASGSTRASWIPRLQHCRDHSPICPLILGGSYNRIEGLPIEIGPSLVLRNDRARLRVDALFVARSVDDFRWTSSDVGYDVTARLSDAHDRHFAVGGRLYDIVDPTERWQLRDAEVGLASFFFRRDYRDYYNRHGGGGFFTLKNGHGVDLSLSLSDEVWSARRDRAPFSLFSNDATWRPNPQMDEGHFHIAGASIEVDTRSDDVNPRTGWWIVADAERGTSRAVTLSPFSLAERGLTASDPVPVTYTRGFLDLRRYNRLSPTGQLNMRLVLGGWLGGDRLPLQRRFALGGPGTLPGFDFRSTPGAVDVMTCSPVGPLPGKPGLCDRIALAQLELRGGFGLQAHGHGEIEDWFLDVDHGAQWVLFGDMGRGWLVNGSPQLGTLHYGGDAFPPLNSFQGDAGVGLDFNFIGFFVAKAISEPKEPVNFFVRLRHRF